MGQKLGSARQHAVCIRANAGAVSHTPHAIILLIGL
jgi:hypothetical protein